MHLKNHPCILLRCYKLIKVCKCFQSELIQITEQGVVEWHFPNGTVQKHPLKNILKTKGEQSMVQSFLT